MEVVAIGVVIAYLVIRFWKFVLWVLGLALVAWVLVIQWVMDRYDLSLWAAFFGGQ